MNYLETMKASLFLNRHRDFLIENKVYEDLIGQFSNMADGDVFCEDMIQMALHEALVYNSHKDVDVTEKYVDYHGCDFYNYMLEGIEEFPDKDETISIILPLLESSNVPAGLIVGKRKITIEIPQYGYYHDTIELYGLLFNVLNECKKLKHVLDSRTDEKVETEVLIMDVA